MAWEVLMSILEGVAAVLLTVGALLIASKMAQRYVRLKYGDDK